MQTNLGDLVLGIFEGVFDRFDGGGLGRAIVRLGGVLGREPLLLSFGGRHRHPESQLREFEGWARQGTHTNEISNLSRLDLEGWTKEIAQIRFRLEIKEILARSVHRYSSRRALWVCTTYANGVRTWCTFDAWPDLKVET